MQRVTKALKTLIFQGILKFLVNKTAAERVLKYDFCVKFDTIPFK